MKKVGKTTRPFRDYLNQIRYDYTVEVRNRFKGLDLINRVPDELWNEVRDIVQETGIKTIPMDKKCKKAKWLSGEALQIAVKRREAKSKGEKERYKHLKAEFQRITRRDKKAFLSDQCKEIDFIAAHGLSLVISRSYSLVVVFRLLIVMASFQYLLLLLRPYHFCPLSSPSLHEMFPWYL